MPLPGEPDSGGGADVGASSDAAAGRRGGSLAGRACRPERAALDPDDREPDAGLAAFARRAFAVGSCVSPSRRGLRTPGRELGRFPKTPRSRDGGSGVSGSEFIGGVVRSCTDLDGSAGRCAPCVTPCRAAGCMCRRTAIRLTGGSAVVDEGLAFPQQIARNRRAYEAQRISCQPSFECPYAGRDPGDGSAPLPSDCSSCRRIGFGAPSQAAPDWGIRGDHPIYRLSTETIPAHDHVEGRRERANASCGDSRA